jgi:hypothetical protein
VSAWSAQRSLRDVIEETLRPHVAPDDVRHLYGDTFLIDTDAEVATIRNWLLPCLKDRESLFVVEFERWSGYGPAPDRDWLLRRGH